MKEDPGLCQFHPSLLAVEEGDAQLTLQVHDLPGEGRLGDVQLLGGLCDIIGVSDREKVFDDARVHMKTSRF